MRGKAEDSQAEDSERFVSFVALRAAHAQLLRHNVAEPAGVDDIRAFLQRGVATGALLDDSEDRWEAQSLLDYWVATLDRMGKHAPDATLVGFDPELSPELDDELCPYRGLDAFRLDQQQFFFGRQRLIGVLLRSMRSHRVLPVLGPSGSGKSSVVMAGLLPALQRGEIEGSDRWHYLPPAVPGTDPLESLARMARGEESASAEWLATEGAQLRKKRSHLADLLADITDRPAVVVIDQLEEIFTLCEDDNVRDAFVGNLLYLAGMEEPQHRLILTMRTDFEASIAKVEKLQQHFEQASVRVTPMSAHELRDAITRPAELVGLKFEAGLVDQLIHDIVGEAAALPLLQFTLLKLWEKRARNRVTRAAYKELGSGRTALALSADRFYKRRIPEDQETIKYILLQLVRPGEGTEVMSNRVRRSTLLKGGPPAERVERNLKSLIDEHLVRVTSGDEPDRSDDRVEVAHEALVRNWPTLVDWLDEERSRLKHRLQLTSAAERWATSGRLNALLLRGQVLEEARSHDDLGETERAFVRASEQRERRERRFKRNALVAVIALLTTATGVAVLSAIGAGRQASFAEVQTRFAMEERRLAEGYADSLEAQTRQLTDALDRARVLEQELVAQTVQANTSASDAIASREAADDARRLAEREADRNLSLVLSRSSADNIDRDPELSLLLALQALQTAQTDAAEDALHQAIRASRLELTLAGHDGVVASAVFTPSGDKVITGSLDGTARVWDASSGELLREVTGDLEQDEGIVRVDVSPDGSMFAAFGRGGPARVWDLESGAERLRVGNGGTEYFGGAYSPNGSMIAKAEEDGTIGVWDSGSGALITSWMAEPVFELAYLDGGRMIATSGEGGMVRFWDALNGDSLNALSAEFEGRVVFAYAAGILATGGVETGFLKLWVSNSPVVMFSVDIGGVYSIAFSPDEDWLAVGGADGVVRVYALDELGDPEAGFRPAFVLSGHEGSVYRVSFSSDGSRILTASEDGTARIWTAGEGEEAVKLRAGGHRPVRLAFDPASPDQLALADSAAGVTLWSISNVSQKAVLGSLKDARDVAYSSDGRVAAIGAGDTMRVWEAATGNLLRQLTHDQTLRAVAFSRDGRLIAAGADSGRAIAWEVETGEVALDLLHQSRRVNRAGNPLGPAPSVIDLAFSFGDERLVTVAGDELYIWDLEENRTGTGSDWEVSRVYQETTYSFAAAFEPRGSRLAYTGRREARVLDATTFENVLYLQGHRGNVTSVAFSPDGSRIATGSADRAAIVWDAQTGRPITRLTGHHTGIVDVAFTSDGSQLVVADAAGNVLIHALDLDALKAIAANRLTRGFTDDECETYLGRPCEPGDAGSARRR